MSTNINKIIESCGKYRVKKLKFKENEYEIEFYPESGDQITPSFHPSLTIDPTLAKVPESVEKEYQKIREEDEREMQILEDPTAFEEQLLLNDLDLGGNHE